VVAHALDHERRARVAYPETLARLPVDEDSARRRAVGDDISRDNVIFRPERIKPFLARRTRRDDYRSAGKRLSDIVVRLSNEIEGNALCEKCAERLPGNAAEVDGDGVLNVLAMGDKPAGKRRAYGTVAVGDRAREGAFTARDGWDQLASVVVGVGRIIRVFRIIRNFRVFRNLRIFRNFRIFRNLRSSGKKSCAEFICAA
jgi:hypothetical protein